MSKLEELKKKYEDEFRSESYIDPKGGLYGKPAKLWKIVTIEEFGIDDEGNPVYLNFVKNCKSEEEAYELLDESFQPRQKFIVDGIELY